ncbi:MAG: cation:proton antiporter [Candidatus Aenigmarchaeota archaeon]|nr:cation:proton antiporter [Candidatus Aenigmarchaeota archaeon]
MIVTAIFTVVGFIIVLGFLGNYLFKKTGIPDIIVLLCLGLLLGPVFHVVDPSVFRDVSQLFASLALMILLFEGGLNLNIYKVFQESPRAVLLATLVVITSMIITSVFTSFFWGWSLLQGLLLGAMIGGSSSSIVVPLVRKVNVGEKIVTLMSLESAFTDALTVVIGITIIQLLVSPAADTLYTISHGIASAFSIGAMLGLLLGVIWLKMLRLLKEESYRNILTLAIVFLLYSFVQSLGGNGAISSLMFGLVLGNAKPISKIIKAKQEMKTEKAMKEFHSEISFLVRTFFFVYLGLIVMVNDMHIVFLSILLSSLLLIGRLFSVFLATLKEPTLKKNRDLMGMMLPRGLAAAVLSQLPIAYGLKNANMYSDIVFTVIIVTVLICTIGVFGISKKMKREKVEKK